ncbi:PaaI family thioesterase [Noviherbaspirillum denitrificans]|uniref:Competence protein ComA n=1 Tax=Noviherbaspirillum denitrificans TaxID=1968433 RepID=A0A254TB84_9BURK|nr:PaaI family thioesterase [Noviherbaspirillum denitrificans]OWW19901.1 competence protein ComA [Noviherbaspirillum denitrificans]
MGHPLDAASFNERGAGYLPGHLGIKINSVDKHVLHSELEVQGHHLAPNGYLHAGTVVTLADTSCGYGCIASLPEGAVSFTTIELKSNFLGTAREGVVECEAKLVHGGRNTQVWDALVKHRDTGKLMATFRCTQMILYPKS